MKFMKTSSREDKKVMIAHHLGKEQMKMVPIKKMNIFQKTGCYKTECVAYLQMEGLTV